MATTSITTKASRKASKKAAVTPAELSKFLTNAATVMGADDTRKQAAEAGAEACERTGRPAMFKAVWSAIAEVATATPKASRVLPTIREDHADLAGFLNPKWTNAFSIVLAAVAGNKALHTAAVWDPYAGIGARDGQPLQKAATVCGNVTKANGGGYANVASMAKKAKSVGAFVSALDAALANKKVTQAEAEARAKREAEAAERAAKKAAAQAAADAKRLAELEEAAALKASEAREPRTLTVALDDTGDIASDVRTTFAELSEDVTPEEVDRLRDAMAEAIGAAIKEGWTAARARASQVTEADLDD